MQRCPDRVVLACCSVAVWRMQRGGGLRFSAAPCLAARTVFALTCFVQSTLRCAIRRRPRFTVLVFPRTAHEADKTCVLKLEARAVGSHGGCGGMRLSAAARWLTGRGAWAAARATGRGAPPSACAGCRRAAPPFRRGSPGSPRTRSRPARLHAVGDTARQRRKRATRLSPQQASAPERACRPRREEGIPQPGRRCTLRA